MLIENPESLQTWLTSYLEPLCDADPQALAQYVMALIGKDKPTEDLKHILSEQLEVFLLKETIPFITVLFETLDNKTYLDSVPSGRSPGRSPRGLDHEDGLLSHLDKYVIHDTFDSPPQYLSPYPERNRSRSRSRSRSPPSSSSLNRPRDVDMRRPGSYIICNQGTTSIESGSNFHDELNQPSGWNSSSSRGMSHQCGPASTSSSSLISSHLGGGYSGNQQQVIRGSRTRSKSRSPLRNRSRSNSPQPNSSSNHVRGRNNRLPNRVQSTSRSHSDDGPVSKRTRISSNSQIISNDEPEEEEKEMKPLLIGQRCLDYDERGFCMRGDLCQFDHGSDPLVLEGTVPSVISLNGLAPAQNSSGSANFLNEPYNPEAPAIDEQINRRGSGVGSIHAGGLSPTIDNTHIPQQTFWRPVAPPQLHPTPHLTGSNLINVGTNGQPNSNTASKRGKRKRNRNRGGFRNGYNRQMVNNNNHNKNTLEVRKIPPNLNTIVNLNSHFSKFGSIVNLQVCYDGDPRAALVKFVGHKDAMAAYRSTEAVFNNRFIRVFWHPDNRKQAQQQQSFSSSHPSTNQLDHHHFHPQHHQFHNHSPSSDFINSQYYPSNEFTNSNEFTFARSSNVKDRLGQAIELERNMTNFTPSGSISRTVYNPAYLKGQYSGSSGVNFTEADSSTYMPPFFSNTQVKLETNGEGFGVASFNAPPTVPPAQTVVPPVVKSKEDIQRDKILTKLDLQKKRQHILVCCMQDQKLLIEKLEKAKTDKEKLEIRSTVETFDKQITKLESEIKKDTEIILTEIAELPSSIRKNKIQLEKELLDKEMDFYNDLHNGATATELHKKLQELKTKAKAVCMNDLRSNKNLLKRFAKMRIALRDRNRLANHTLAKNFENLRKVDRRTRKIFIEGVTANENNLLLSHLSQAAEIESLETTPKGVMVTFKTRRDAEMALPLISTVKLKGETPLKASWFDEAVLCSSLLCYISFLCP